MSADRVSDTDIEAEIDFSRVRLANAIPFRLVERSTRDRLRNRTPTQTELHTYGQSVLSDVAKVKPAVIVALGKSAAMLFGVSTPVEQARKHTVLFDRTPVHVTYHPSYVLRQRISALEVRCPGSQSLLDRSSNGAPLATPP